MVTRPFGEAPRAADALGGAETTGEGALLLIGGHEEPGGKILERFAGLVPGSRPIALVTLATEEPAAAFERYRKSFGAFGDQVQHIDAQSRLDCRDPGGIGLLEEAGGIFFTGGDQLRITSVLGGTPLEDALWRAHRRGAVIGGTSAGASAMSTTMLVGGADEESARRATVRMCPGLGFLPDAVVDQHFAQRGRINRLLAALAQNPGTLGIGIDEDTAVLVQGEAMEAFGSGTVTVLDARGAAVGDASEAAVDAPLELGPVGLWVLSHGASFDLARRAVTHSAARPGQHSEVPLSR